MKTLACAVTQNKPAQSQTGNTYKSMEKYIYLIVGLGIGGIIIYLWLKQQFSAQNATLQANVNQAREAQKELQKENEELENAHSM
jgi:uncharacterized protein HemX